MAAPGLVSAPAARRGEILLELLAAPLRGRPRLTFALIAAAAALLYWFTDTRRVGLDAFVPLADAFLHGRLHITEPMSWIEHVDRAGGGWYVPCPPMPALTVLPFVALFGASFDQGVASALVGGLNVALLWALPGRIDVATLSRRASRGRHIVALRRRRWGLLRPARAVVDTRPALARRGRRAPRRRRLAPAGRPDAATLPGALRRTPHPAAPVAARRCRPAFGRLVPGRTGHTRAAGRAVQRGPFRQPP